MRISEDQICARISEMLKEKGFNVVASEVVEGYKKPAVFVNCSPASIELLNRDVEEVTDTIEIKYIPKIETVSHCSKVAQIIRNIFMYKPFDIGDRHLTIQRIEFERNETEEYILYATFDLQYQQETPDFDEYENLETIEMVTKINEEDRGN